MEKLWQTICEILPIDPNMIPLALTIITAAIKRETSLASNQFPMFSPLSGTPREVHGVT